MKKLVCILLCFLCISMQGMKPDEMRQHFLQEACSNMPEEVRQCTSLEDMEAMLRQEEEDSIENIKETYSIPDDVWEEYMDLCTTTRDYIKNEYLTTPRPDRKHSLADVDPSWYEHICESFRKSGIHPDAVDILHVPARSRVKEKSPLGRAGSPCIDVDASIESIVIKKEAETFFCSLQDFYSSNVPIKMAYGDFTYFVPYHEAIHLTEAHFTISTLMHECICKSNSNCSLIWFPLARFHEKMAALLPLIQQKDPALIDGQIKKALQYCMDHARWRRPMTWNKTHNIKERHPDNCTELLPYLLKIKDLIQKEKMEKS